MTTSHADGNPERGAGQVGRARPLTEIPAEPAQPLPPKADQSGPETVGPTGQDTGADPARRPQGVAYLTTAQGVRPCDTDLSPKA